MHKHSVLVFTLILLGLPIRIPGLENEEADLASTMKAVFIYNFTKYIEWPEADITGSFKIGVIGSSGIIAPLRNIAKEKRVGKLGIKIIHISDPGELKDCHILFIAPSERNRLPEILSDVSGKSILTIGDATDFAANGTAINFIVVEGKIKFEINFDAVTRAGLKASSHLLKLAILVEEKKAAK